VIPYLRDMWSEWEDKWSPHPLNQSERALPAAVNFSLLETDHDRSAAKAETEARPAK
jgi:hypothetical protein